MNNRIAIIGLGALYPKSRDLREFWSNVVEARDCIEDVPETHWSIADYYDPDPSAPDKTYCKRGGFIPTVDFDPLEFGLPPSSLEVTDVLQLLSLVVAKQVLADAGAPGSAWYDPSRTGVVLGVTGANSLTQPLATRLQTPVLKRVLHSFGISGAAADEIAATWVKAFAPWEENSFPGMLGNVVAGRIANRFDLGGTNCTVDAACASSLAAVHLAVSELVSGRADLMITGGCDAENTILMYLCFSKTPAFSRSGTIRPFDAAGDGTLIGEGIGMLALKRLADAERDGDRIYAVLRGIGSSSDGRFKSIYAPRREGQVVALNRAYADAGFDPAEVGLVECHGTGTAVGDQTELAALREVFAAAPPASVAVGSVKSQIGHTKAAAGAAGLIKLALALHHKVLPPTINVSRPRAEFAGSPFCVNTSARPWIADPARPVRRAALSSFGFGGTNFHCVLEEHGSAGTALHPVARVHIWHAESASSLAALVESSATCSEHVPASSARLAIVARTSQELASLRAEAVRRLRDDPSSFSLPGCYYRRRAVAWDGSVAAMFAGQGSQYVGMGAQAALAVASVRAAFDLASTSSPLGQVVFPAPAFDAATRAAQEAALRCTSHAQPAVGALALGQYRYLTESGFAADGAIGHSFGELTALCAAGSFSDSTFLRLAWARGQAMSVRSSDPGTMAAVRLDVDKVTELVAAHPDVFVCNINAPDQTVVGGGTSAVRGFVASCRAAGVGAQEIPVASAFHTHYVSGADFRTALSAVDVGRPSFPVYSNVAGASYGDDVAANRDLLVRQIGSPVHFASRIEEMYRSGLRIFVEFGPRAVLGGFVRTILAGHPDVHILAADSGPGTDSDRSLKQLAAQLLVLGLPLHTLNRHASTHPEPSPTHGMRIPLNGVNHLSEKRRQAFDQSLATTHHALTTDPRDHRLPAPLESTATSPSSPDGPHHSAGVTGPRPAVGGHQLPASMEPIAADHLALTTDGLHHSAGTDPRPTSGGHRMPTTIESVAADHLALHREYLTNQLRITEYLATLLTTNPHQDTLTTINALLHHAHTLSQTHIHATELLRTITHPHPTNASPTRTNPTPAPSTRPQPPTHTPAQPSAPSHSPLPALTNPAPAPSTRPQPLTHFPAQPSAPTTTALPPLTNPTPLPSAQPQPSTHTPAQISAPPFVALPPAPTNGAQPTAPSLATPPPAVALTPALSSLEPPAPAGVHPDVVRDAVLAVVSDKTGYPVDMLDTGMDVEGDLGIDSIKRVEIMGVLGEKFGGVAGVGVERLAEVRTLADIVGLLVEVGTGPKG
ncbi:beta-ketoacyl synthase N-terminal-like domain-containing protein [Actinocrispum sp. NPDC049592]|uniref:beta-ketoacyl synthase N-terminal-like domain-containing protein n=1 Tax=Actinocrispum sp. NPDC049592 TaxID=3154835 RepID=UPI003425BB30